MEVAPLGEVVGMATNLFGETSLLVAEAAAAAAEATPLAPALGSKRTCLVVWRAISLGGIGCVGSWTT